MKRRDLLRGLGAAILLGPSVVREVLAAAPPALTGPHILTASDITITVGGRSISAQAVKAAFEAAIYESLSGFVGAPLTRETIDCIAVETELVVRDFDFDSTEWTP